MNREDIIRMAREAGIANSWDLNWQDKIIEAFAKLVAQHERKSINDEAKAHLEELRKNFNAESAELRLHMWSKEKQAPAPFESSIGHMFGDKR
jgi:hypothetical protein